jgi:hypothetical protein
LISDTTPELENARFDGRFFMRERHGDIQRQTAYMRPIALLVPQIQVRITLQIR